MNRTGILLLLAPLFAAGCKDDDGPCRGAACTDASMDATLDAHDGSDATSGTCEGPPGLYADGDCAVLAEGLVPYAPNYWLWSDGLDKERYLYLPPGAQIDTSDPDFWKFPVGTRVYKHFIDSGKRLETRLIERIALTGGDDNKGWRYRTFKWNHLQTSVTELTAGETDVLGTTHNIPSLSDCLTCHNSNAQDALLSVSAIQLNHDLGGAPGVSLSTLTTDGRLSMPISAAEATIPGDVTARAALGYMHANCGHCHRESGNATNTGLRLFVPVDTSGTATVESMPVYTTGVNVCATWRDNNMTTKRLRIDPMSPSTSAVYIRMGRRDTTNALMRHLEQMPPQATEVVDTNGRAAIAAWITSLTATSVPCPP